MSFSAELREAAAPVWERHVAHPFVAGIGDGSLPEDKFRFYVRQDYLFLIDYGRLLALAQEQRVPEQINALAAAAREAGDYSSEQFMQWFIKEQVEEVATMSDLLRVVERSRDDPMEVENFMAREHSSGEASDPTAPKAAGAGA